MPHRQHRRFHARRHPYAGFVDWTENNMDLVPSETTSDSPLRGLANDAAQDDDVATVIQTVYQTLPPTFTGPIAGYSTLSDDDVALPTPAVPTSNPTLAFAGSDQPETPDRLPLTSSVAEAPSRARTFEAYLAEPTAEELPADSAGRQYAQPSPSPAPGPHAASADSLASKDAAAGEEGSSAGVKAGIAFSVLGAVVAVFVVVYLLFSRRRKQTSAPYRLEDGDEKLPRKTATHLETQSVRTDPRAPRISLRPVTQFLPNWNGLDKRASRGPAVSPTPATATMATMRAPAASAGDRPSTGHSTNPANPFGAQAERVPSATSDTQSNRSPDASPVTASDTTSVRSSPFALGTLPPSGGGATVSVGGAAAVAVAVGSGLSRKTSMRRDGPKTVDLTLARPPGGLTPPSPSGTEFSISSVAPGAAVPLTNSAVAIAAAGGPQNSGVHRVQLDFKPTLDDEMELRVGELVRLLHEYDDGWSLVIRLDRSRQGVVPRTCLSTRPVKPRLPSGAPRPGPPVKLAGQARDSTASGGGPRIMTPPGGPRPGLPASPSRPTIAQSSRPSSPALSPLTGLPPSPAGPPAGPVPRTPSAMSRPPTVSPSLPRSPGSGSEPTSPAGPGPTKAARAPRAMSPLSPPPPGPPIGPVGRKPLPGQGF